MHGLIVLESLECKENSKAIVVRTFSEVLKSDALRLFSSAEGSLQ